MIKKFFSYVFSSDLDILAECKIENKSDYRYVDVKTVNYLKNIKQKSFKNNILYMYEYKGILKKVYKNILIVSEIERLVFDIIKKDIYLYIKEFKIKNIFVEKDLVHFFRRFNIKFKMIDKNNINMYGKDDLLIYLMIYEKDILNINRNCHNISIIFRKEMKNGK